MRWIAALALALCVSAVVLSYAAYTPRCWGTNPDCPEEPLKWYERPDGTWSP